MKYAVLETNQATSVQIEVATQEAMTIPTSKNLEMTSEMRELMVQLAPILLGGTNASLPLHEGTITTIVETGSGSALPTTVTDIMEDLPFK